MTDQVWIKFFYPPWLPANLNQSSIGIQKTYLFHFKVSLYLSFGKWRSLYLLSVKTESVLIGDDFIVSHDRSNLDLLAFHLYQNPRK